MIAATSVATRAHRRRRVAGTSLPTSSTGIKEKGLTVNSCTSSPNMTDSHSSNKEHEDNRGKDFSLRRQRVYDCLERLPRQCTILCFVWVWMWLILGNTTSGKQAYQSLVSRVTPFETDAKGGLPLMTMTLPILITSIVCLIVRTVTQQGGSAHVMRTRLQQQQQQQGRGGDPCFDTYAIWMVVLPLSCYVVMSMYTRWSISSIVTPSSFNERLLGTANAFGSAALIALSLGMIPVSRRSVFLKVMGWNATSALRFHIWSGRTVIVASFVHGAMHIFRLLRLGYHLKTILWLPPLECWTTSRASILHCSSSNIEECVCYNRWLNVTGLLALVGLGVIAISTLQAVRRKLYNVFYRIHVVAGPLVLLATCLHWNRSILYLSGGLLYYMASSFALLLEQQYNTTAVPIVSVEHLPAFQANERPSVALTVEATEMAVSHLEAGQFVKLRVKEISPLSHPFTINRVVGQPHLLRIIFRLRGPFTQRLANELLSSSQCQSASHRETKPTSMADCLPKITLDGYHGVGRVEQALLHDVVFIVAGGIGITPYLSLLYDVLTSHQAIDGRLKTIVLHWMCREQSLVDYVLREYLAPLQATRSVPLGCQVKIYLHRTGESSPALCDVPATLTTVESRLLSERARSSSSPAVDIIATNRNNCPPCNDQPFHPSSIPSSSRGRLYHRTSSTGILTFALTALPSFPILWNLYRRSNLDATSIAPRLYAPVALALWGVFVAWIMVVVMRPKFSIESSDATTNTTASHDRSESESLLPIIDEEQSCSCVELGSTTQLIEGSSKSKKHRNDYSSCGSSPASLTIEESELAHRADGMNAIRITALHGRPSMNELLLWNDTDSIALAQHPGVFVCGPPELGRELRSACIQQQQQQQQQQPPENLSKRGSSGASSAVSWYEESFEF